MTVLSEGHDRNTLAMLVKGHELRRQADYAGALSIYLEVFTLLGGRPEILALIALCHFSMAQLQPDDASGYEHAVTWAKKAVAAAPDQARYHVQLAQYYWLGLLDYEEALASYRKAIELDPYCVPALNSAAVFYSHPDSSLGLSEAIDWLERSARLNEDDPTVHYWLGNCYWEAGLHSKARDAWRRVFECPSPVDLEFAETVEAALRSAGALSDD